MNTGVVKLNVLKVEHLIGARGLKKTWIAAEMGVNRMTLFSVLRKGSGRRTTIRALALVLGVSEEDIAA